MGVRGSPAGRPSYASGNRQFEYLALFNLNALHKALRVRTKKKTKDIGKRRFGSKGTASERRGNNSILFEDFKPANAGQHQA